VSRPTRIRELPEQDRPREKLLARGPGSLTDAELLALFLRTGQRGKSAIDLAAELIGKRGSLQALSRSAPSELVGMVAGIGEAKAAELAAAFELGKRLARGDVPRPKLDSPEAIHSFIGPALSSLPVESLRVLLLDTRYQLIRDEEISLGSLNESIAHPREIFRPAIAHRAYALVIAHNHPSGDPSPSEADRRLTRRLSEAATLLGIKLVDHLIIGNADGGRQPYFSFKEHGSL